MRYSASLAEEVAGVLAATVPLGIPSGKTGHHPGWKPLQLGGWHGSELLFSAIDLCTDWVEICPNLCSLEYLPHLLFASAAFACCLFKTVHIFQIGHGEFIEDIELEVIDPR